MKKLREMYSNTMGNRNLSIEARLTCAFIECNIIWSLIMAIGFFTQGLIVPSINLLIMFIVLVVLFPLGIKYKKQFFMHAYLTLVLISVPPVWYICGGNRSSANALFLLETILFAMALKGTRQKVMVILSMFSTSLVYALSNAFPGALSGYLMTPQQNYMTSTMLGSSVTIWVAFLIMFQKREYRYENKRALEATEELKVSNRMQKNFLANMSHEIRSPLGIVLGFNHLISESNDLDQIHEYSANIEQAGKTLKTVINDILDYSKIEAGKLDIIEDDYLLEDVISEIQHDISMRCESKGLILNVQRGSSLPKYLHGDSTRIRQCLLNLLTNAVKYTDKGTIDFSIESTSVNESFLLKFTVTDTGRGISEEMIPKIFDSFQRLDEGHNRGIEGTGLGLAITKSLLGEMGGTISVQSTYGAGSTFTVELLQHEGQEKKVSVDNTQEISVEGINVLVVDDTAVNVSLIERVLTKKGVVVKGLNNGKDALLDCAENKYDLILMDHMMPEMDGVETFKRLKEQGGINANTPIIMLTANAMAGANLEYKSIGFDDYISKPINMKELIEKIYIHTR